MDAREREENEPKDGRADVNCKVTGNLRFHRVATFPRVPCLARRRYATTYIHANILDTRTVFDQMASPPHWPQHLRYLRSPSYHESVPADIRRHLGCPTPNARVTRSSQSHKATPVAIRRILGPKHPAVGQFGLFSSKKIPPRSHILDYIGEVHCDDRPESNYDLSLYRNSDGLNVGVDASRMGNEARFINDYRGVAARPNAVFEEHRTLAGELCMAVWSGSEEIKKGQEILVSYGKGFWSARS